MLPKPPPRETPPGFLYIPPYRIYGHSIAGESTCLQIPELDIAFDMGQCLRPSLAAKWVAISHGHMDHIGALAYYCSQRRFQGMGTAKIVCDARLAGPINRMMAGFVDLEQQRTPFEVFPLEPEQQLEIKPNIFLRGFPTEHTSPSFGYAIVERRSKLKPEYAEQPQEKLRELKEKGVEITRALEIPLVAYLGDTAPGAHLIRNDVRTAEIVICECTFFEPDHVERAKVGMHLHVNDIAEWLRVLECKALILTHISRRTHLGLAREQLTKLIGPEKAKNVFLLMDNRFNRDRYEQQEAAAGIVHDRPGAEGRRPARRAAPAPEQQTKE
ncbi:MAG: MBL fold metallo-hydrolase [Phycisphaerales bacterium]